MRIRKNGKIIKLTESDLKMITKKMLKEYREEMSFNNIAALMKDEFPLFQNMEGFNLTQPELVYVFSTIFEQPVFIKGNSIEDEYGNQIYHEKPNGEWTKSEYDYNGNLIYKETSDGEWEKFDGPPMAESRRYFRNRRKR